jgi:DNA-directed RNA polymerase specialized sigma24 family protein
MGWMLQSGQVDHSLLAETLVREYYLPVYRLAHSLLDDERLAERAAQSTSAAALAEARTYPSSCGVRAWLFRRALDVCQSICRKNQLRCALRSLLFFPHRLYRFGTSIPRDDGDVAIWRALDRMKDPLRLVTLLYFVYGWTPADIACLLGCNEKEERNYLITAKARFAEALRNDGLSSDEVEGEPLDRRVRQSLGTRYPLPVISVDELNRIAAGLAEEEVEQAPHRRRWTTFSEVAWMGCVVILAILLIWGSNTLMVGSISTPKPPAVAATQWITSPTPSPDLKAQATMSVDTADPIPSSPVILYYSPQPGETLLDVAIKMGVTVAQLAIYNQLPAKPELTISGPIRIPFPSLPQGFLMPTLIRHSELRLPPLSSSSSSAQVAERLLVSEHLWHTLWADAIVLNTPRDSNSPKMTHLQLWVNQPDYSLELVGPLEGDPQYAFLGAGKCLYSRWISCGEYGSCNPPHQVEWAEAYRLLDTSQAHDLLLPGRSSWMNEAGRFQIVGKKRLPGARR